MTWIMMDVAKNDEDQKLGLTTNEQDTGSWWMDGAAW
jgi:hypothetical protein